MKTGLTLEDIEHGIPHAQQLTLLKHTHALEPENRILECDIHRWVLRSMVRGEDRGEESVEQSASFLSQYLEDYSNSHDCTAGKENK